MNTPAPPLTDHLADARATGYFFIREQFSDAQLDGLRRVYALVGDEVLPVIAGYWERGTMPWSLIRRIGELGIVGKDIDGYGCPGFDPIACGLVHLELNRGDGSLDTFVGVHAGLAVKSIAILGSEEQRQDWPPGMARLEKLGAFALTDPNHGSDSVALETTARRDGDQSVISGAKRLGVEPGRALTGSVSAVSSIALTGGFPWPCWTISASMARWPSSLARRPVWGSRSPWHWQRPVPTSRSVHAGSTA